MQRYSTVRKNLNLTAIFATIAIFIFAACSKDEPTEPKQYQIIEPVSIECEYLDSIFSFTNALLPYHVTWTNQSYRVLCYVFDSQEQLNERTPSGFEVDWIDFTQYTLIGGFVDLNNKYYSEINITLREEENVYNFHILMNYRNGEHTALNNRLFFWRLYPKLKADKKMNLSMTNIN